MLEPVQDYSLGDVARILKVSPRRLRYWQKTQLVESSAPGELHEGYAFRDLVCLRTVVTLLEKGVPLQRIRRSLETLRDRDPNLTDPIAALRLLDEVPDRLVVRREGRLEETGGQMLLEFDRLDSTNSEQSQSEVTSLSAALLGEDSEQGTGRRSPRLDPLSKDLTAAANDSIFASAADRALDWFERGCDLDSDPAKWDRAIEAYQKALELSPDYADAHCNLGAVQYNKGRREEARRAFAACLRCESDHIEANFNLANVLEEQGEDKLALVHYRRALMADPLYPDLHINLALLYEKLRRDRRAAEHWRRYLQIDPHGSWADVARLHLERKSYGRKAVEPRLDRIDLNGSRDPLGEPGES